MSRGPKNFDEAIEKLKDEVPAPESTPRDMLGDLEKEFRKVWSSLQGMTGEVGPGAARVKDEAEQKVAQSPWMSIGLVGVVCLVLGYLMGRGRSE